MLYINLTGVVIMARLSDEQKALLDKVMNRKICEAAAEVITQHGLEHMTMDKVAEAAGVAKGTLYNYFKDRDDLIINTENAVFGPLLENVDAIIVLDSEPLVKLSMIVKMLLEHFSKYRKLLIILHDSRISGILGNKERFEKRERIISLVSKIIVSAMELGQFRQVEPRIAAEIFLGMIMSINISKIITGHERPLEQELNTIMTIFSHGIELTGNTKAGERK